MKRSPGDPGRALEIAAILVGNKRRPVTESRALAAQAEVLRGRLEHLGVA